MNMLRDRGQVRNQVMHLKFRKVDFSSLRRWSIGSPGSLPLGTRYGTELEGL